MRCTLGGTHVRTAGPRGNGAPTKIAAQRRSALFSAKNGLLRASTFCILGGQRQRSAVPPQFSTNNPKNECARIKYPWRQMGLGLGPRGFEVGVLVSGFWVLGFRVFEICVWVSGFGDLDCSDLVFGFWILDFCF